MQIQTFILSFFLTSYTFATPLTQSVQPQASQEQQQIHSEFFNPRTQVYFIRFKDISQQVMTLSLKINAFLKQGLAQALVISQSQQQTADEISLVNFEYTELPEETVESYERRKHFGGWVKDKNSGDCFNTRNKVLVRDNIGTLKFKEDNKCSVAEGLWIDPYSGVEMTNAQDEIQIDHMIPMSEAYQSGAHNWSFKQRCLFGNYLGYKNHLLPVYGEENNNKGSQTPEDYMPTLTGYHCQYLKDWLKIKTIWGLHFSPTEVAAIKQRMTEAACKPEEFILTRSELLEQVQFMTENADLCKPYEFQ